MLGKIILHKSGLFANFKAFSVQRSLSNRCMGKTIHSSVEITEFYCHHFVDKILLMYLTNILQQLQYLFKISEKRMNFTQNFCQNRTFIFAHFDFIQVVPAYLSTLPM